MLTGGLALTGLPQKSGASTTASALSPAVVKAAENAIIILNNATASGKPTIAQVSAAETALSTLFQNMEETGFNADFNTVLASMKLPSVAQREALIASARSAGLNVSTTVQNDFLNITQSNLDAALKIYPTAPAIEQAALNGLSQILSSMQKPTGVAPDYLITLSEGDAIVGICIGFGGLFFPEIGLAMAVVGLYYGALGVVEALQGN